MNNYHTEYKTQAPVGIHSQGRGSQGNILRGGSIIFWVLNDKEKVTRLKELVREGSVPGEGEVTIHNMGPATPDSEGCCET